MKILIKDNTSKAIQSLNPLFPLKLLTAVMIVNSDIHVS